MALKGKVCVTLNGSFKILQEITALGLHRKVWLMVLFAASSRFSWDLWIEILLIGKQDCEGFSLKRELQVFLTLWQRQVSPNRSSSICISTYFLVHVSITGTPIMCHRSSSSGHKEKQKFLNNHNIRINILSLSSFFFSVPHFHIL